MSGWEDFDRAAGELDRLRAENERLRAALGNIRAALESIRSDSKAADRAWEYALAALEGSTNE